MFSKSNKDGSLRSALTSQPDMLQLIAAVENNDTRALRQQLTALVNKNDVTELPMQFLSHTVDALERGDWSFFATAFRNMEFVGAHGLFLLIAPYRAARGGKSEQILSAIFGRILDLDRVPETLPVLKALFGKVKQAVPVVIPFEAIAVAGWFTGEKGEAFIVPNGWPGLEAGEAPSLNNMAEQAKRIGSGAKAAIRRVFDHGSADLLLSAYEQGRLFPTLHAEYGFHEAGHASGLGLDAKLAAGVFNSPWYGAVEEWRADGVAFEIARRTLPKDRAGQLIASNMITRFGIDAHRRGGLGLDTDVNATVLTFNCLLDSGTVTITPNGHLSFETPTFEGLVCATELMCARAIALTRKELHLEVPQASCTLYVSANVPDGVRQLFDYVVREPLKGTYTDLR